MQTLKLSRQNQEMIADRSADLIKKGGVVVCPTDTIYGLISDATNRMAVGKVFAIKQRPKNRSLPIFFQSIEMAKSYGEIDEKTEKILKKFWPGKITFILKRRLGLKIYGVAPQTIAARIPNNKFIALLLEKTGKPLTGTSANISGQGGISKIKEIIKAFQGQVNYPDLIIDAGNLFSSKPSTIVNLASKPFQILRRGSVKIHLKDF